MKNCKNLKLRTKKGQKYLYCNTLKEVITFEECKNCSNKEYKSTLKTKKLFKIDRNKQILTKKCKKLAILETKRTSVFVDDLKVCYLCGSNYKVTKHEIFAGRNRQNSMKYNFILPLCLNCHSINQENTHFNEFWHKKAQLYWEENLGTREEFIKVFGRNYIK